MNSLNCKKDYTQSELAAMYEHQQSREGQLAMTTRKAFLKAVVEQMNVCIPIEEVGIIRNGQTGEKRYFISQTNPQKG